MIRNLLLVIILLPSLAFGQGYLSGPDQVKVVSESGEAARVTNGGLDVKAMS